MQTTFSHYINIWLVKIYKFVKIEILDSQQNASLTQRNILKGPNVSNFKTLTLKITPGMPKCHNRILFHYADIVWTFYLKSVPAKFQKYFKLISWVISGTSSSKLSCNPCHPSRNNSCNHRHHLLQPSWRRVFSTSNNQKTRVDSDINIDYKASSFDKLYIWRRKWDTAGFVRAHQRKYWNALTVGRGHADDGCSCNHRAVPPSVVGFYIKIWLVITWMYNKICWPYNIKQNTFFMCVHANIFIL